MSTLLERYVQEVRTEAGHLIESRVRTPAQVLPEADAAGAGRLRDAISAENRAARDSGVGASAPRSPEEKLPGPANRQKVAEIVRSSREQRGNFGVGRASRAEADAAGLAWVGVDAQRLPYNDTYRLVSKDGLWQYRPPQRKPAGRGVQANYEWRSDSNRHWQSNAHLDIEER